MQQRISPLYKTINTEMTIGLCESKVKTLILQETFQRRIQQEKELQNS